MRVHEPHQEGVPRDGDDAPGPGERLAPERHRLAADTLRDVAHDVEPLQQQPAPGGAAEGGAQLVRAPGAAGAVPAAGQRQARAGQQELPAAREEVPEAGGGGDGEGGSERCRQQHAHQDQQQRYVVVVVVVADL